jgi:GNAT superfamily N-acetyltransferase
MTIEAHPKAVPPGYPREYERRLHLADGRAVLVRPIVPADAAALGEAIRSADSDTLRRRFLGGPPHVTPALLTRLTTVDYRRRFALTAADEATGRGVAIARYESMAEGVAEVAVVVDPAWRRVGLATALIEMLAQAALERGISAFSATYLAENRPVDALLGLAGRAGRQLIKQGIAEFVVRLDAEQIAAALRARDEDEDAAPDGGAGAAAGDWR